MTWQHWRPVPVREFNAITLPTPKWVVENLVPGDGWTYLIGLPKTGKSILAAQVADAIVEGQPVLDCPAPVAGVVVYVQVDAPVGVWQAQLRDILPDSRVLTMTMPKGVLTIPGGLEKARRLLDELRPALVVWDALEHLSGNLSVNDESSAKEILRRLKVATPGPFVVVHHPRKPGKGDEGAEDPAVAAAGHHYLAGDASAILMLEKTGEQTGRLRIVCRLIEDRTVKLERDSVGRWRLRPAQPRPVQTPRDSVAYRYPELERETLT